MSGLPRLAAFKSTENGKYLRFVIEPGQTHGFLEFSGDDVLNPISRFELEKTSSYPQGLPDKELVNIRCCYNNKYWRKESENSHWIVVGADEAVQDLNRWSSTLFELVIDSGDGKDSDQKMVQINHYHGELVLLVTPNSGDSEIKLHRSFLRNVKKELKQNSRLCELIELDKLMIMPKFVALKGDNDLFIQPRGYSLSDGFEYVQFSTRDVADLEVGCEVVTNTDGSIQMKFTQRSPFWALQLSDGSIYARVNEKILDPNIKHRPSFLPIIVEEDVMALYCLENNKFCSRSGNYLEATSSDIVTEAKLKVLEFVTSREIYNVRFHEEDARVYNSKRITLARKEIKNNSRNNITTEVSLAADTTYISSWKTTASWKLGVKANINVSSIPTVSENFQVKVESKTDYKWGEGIEIKEKLTEKFAVTVQPTMKAIVSMVGIRAYVDIPFTYSQRDTLINGDTKIYSNMRDGIYTCLVTYNIQTIVATKDLSPEDLEE